MLLHEARRYNLRRPAAHPRRFSRHHRRRQNRNRQSAVLNAVVTADIEWIFQQARCVGGKRPWGLMFQQDSQIARQSVLIPLLREWRDAVGRFEFRSALVSILQMDSTLDGGKPSLCGEHCPTGKPASTQMKPIFPKASSLLAWVWASRRVLLSCRRISALSSSPPCQVQRTVPALVPYVVQRRRMVVSIEQMATWRPSQQSDQACQGPHDDPIGGP